MADENKSNRKKSERKRSKKSKKKQKISGPEDKVMQDFAACPRCSYFWAGYKVIAGDKGITTAVNEKKDGWLTLQWSHPMRELVHKSFGVRLDADFFHYEGCCQDCTRPFFFQAPEEEKAGIFRIELAPLREKI